MIREQHAHAMTYVQPGLEAGVQEPTLLVRLLGLQLMCLQTQKWLVIVQQLQHNSVSLGMVHPRTQLM